MSRTLFGRENGGFAQETIACAVCDLEYGRNTHIIVANFAGATVCGNCFERIEAEILGRMPDILSWYRDLQAGMGKDPPEIAPAGEGAVAALLQTMMQSPAFGIRLLSELQTAQGRIGELEKQLFDVNLLSADAPASASSILVGDMAKRLRQAGADMGTNRFFQWLRENGYLIDGSGEDRNMPTQHSLDLGLFEVRKTPVGLGGITKIGKTPMVTAAGQQHFMDLFNPVIEEFTLWEMPAEGGDNDGTA